MQKNGIRANLEIKENKLSIEADDWFLRHPSTDEDKDAHLMMNKQYKDLSKQTLESLLLDNEKEFNEKMNTVLDSVCSLMRIQSNQTIIKEELALLELINKAKEYIQENQGIFNHLKEETMEETKRYSLTNKVYHLYIRVNNFSYRKKHTINVGFGLNSNVFPFWKCKTLIESFENNSYNEQEKIEKYVQNKLNRYKYLFEKNNIILKEHVERFSIPERMLKELGIQVFNSKEDILKL